MVEGQLVEGRRRGARNAKQDEGPPGKRHEAHEKGRRREECPLVLISIAAVGDGGKVKSVPADERPE